VADLAAKGEDSNAAQIMLMQPEKRLISLLQQREKMRNELDDTGPMGSR
jgi:hypothetical protein